jgi:hypothetical protein
MKRQTEIRKKLEERMERPGDLRVWVAEFLPPP